MSVTAGAYFKAAPAQKTAVAGDIATVASVAQGGSAEYPFRVLIATDAWRPQVNGVVRTLEGLMAEAPAFGAEIVLLTPTRFFTIPMPGYPEIRLAAAGRRAVARAIEAARPDVIHIATEGPIGLQARRYCMRRRIPFTTCYHTRFPEYIAARYPVPASFIYRLMRRFHNKAAATMVSTPTLAAELARHGIARTMQWRRGVDVETFATAWPARLDLPRPIFLTVGRVAIEKNLDAFLSLDLPGSKVVIGDGPARADLAARWPQAHFLGLRRGADLAAHYAAADVFVFPSRTDTFGLVMLEALAAGTPVAAFPVAGPLDVLGDSGCGALNEDLRAAALAALQIPRARCRLFGARHTMRESARSFLRNIDQALLGGRYSALATAS